MADQRQITASERPAKRTPAQLKAFMELAFDRFRIGNESTHKQKERELADLRFYSGGDNQWDPDQLKARKAQQAASGGAVPLPPVPARPVITINKIKEPIHQVQNEERLSDLTPELVASDDFEDLVGPIDPTEIELREGIVRRIQREPETEAARSWAFQRALIAGQGYYVVMYRYGKGKTFDQEVYVHKIFNQNGVVLDPAHEDQTGADCEWGFIGDYMTGVDYDAHYPYRGDKKNKIKIKDMNGKDWQALGDQAPEWFKTQYTTEEEGPDGRTVKRGKKTRMVRVMHYWYFESEESVLYQLADGSTVSEEDLELLDPDAPEDAIIDERIFIEKKLKWALMDGEGPLEECDWCCDDFPIVKVVAEELQPWDRERHVEGMVRQSRGGQMGYNAMVSKLVETVGLTPIPPLLIAEGQATGLEAWYQLATTRTLPFLIYKAYDHANRPLVPPTRPPVETAIESITVSIQMFDEAIKSTTMIPGVQLGQATDPAMKTARGIQLLQQASQQSTSSFMDQYKHSVRREGQIINNMLYPIYGKRPGRLLRMMTGEGEKKTVTLADPKPAQDPMQMDQGNSTIVAQSQYGPKEYRLTEGANFNVDIKVSKNSETRRQAAAELFQSSVNAVPQAITWFGDLMFKYSDAPGSKEASERMEVVLDPKIQSYLTQKKGSAQQLPPEIMAQLAQQQAQIQRLEQIAQMAQQELTSKTAERQIDQQTKLQVSQAETDRAIKIQAMKDATTLEVARITAAKAMFDTRLAFVEEQMALQKKIAHESTEAGQDRMHEHVQGELERRHEKAMTEAQQQHDSIMAAGDQAHESDLSAAQQAADAEQSDQQRQHEASQQTQQQAHEADQNTQQQVVEAAQGAEDRQHEAAQATQQQAHERKQKKKRTIKLQRDPESGALSGLEISEEGDHGNEG